MAQAGRQDGGGGVRWSDAYDVQMDLLRFWESDWGPLHAIRMTELAEREGDKEAVTEACRTMATEERITLSEAAPVAVSDEVVDLVSVASDTWQPEALRASDLLIPAGFVLLPRTVLLGRAFSWRTEGESIHGSFYRAEPGSASLRPTLPLVWPFETSVGVMEEHNRLTFGWVQVFWRIAQQTISTIKRERADRGSRRRAARVGDEEPIITVVRLRRAEKRPTENETEVDWRSRWIVGGHWRNQWFPSLGDHRQIWIAPYIKGPEDKPLRVNHGRAFEVVR